MNSALRGTNDLHHGMRSFISWIARLFRDPVFLFVTLWGHAAILSGAAAFRYFEGGANPRAESFLDAYYWAIATTTTVGSDIVPVTHGGKIVAMLMMILGALFLWSYTAIFAAGFVGTEMRKVEKDVKEMERDIRLDQATLEKLLAEIELLRRRLGEKT